MADAPQGLTLKKHRDSNHAVELWGRRALLTALAALALVALLNVLGQNPVASAAAGDDATLEVLAPADLRGGVFYMGRFTITAEREIADATLVLDEGWLESMHINTIEPVPVDESSREGRLALNFGRVRAGESVTAYLEFQVNPTNVGSRSQDVELHDGETLLARVDRTVTIYP